MMVCMFVIILCLCISPINNLLRNLSLLIKQNNDPSLPDEVYLNETSEKIDLIIDDYINSSNEHFYETGTYISPNMWEDLDLCSQILESKD